MSLGRAIFCIILPPLAVLDRGCGTVLVVTVLTIPMVWPGSIAALIINYLDAKEKREAANAS